MSWDGCVVRQHMSLAMIVAAPGLLILLGEGAKKTVEEVKFLTQQEHG